MATTDTDFSAQLQPRDEPTQDAVDNLSLIRIILADSQAIYRVGIRKIFALEDDIRVVAQVETLSNLYAALERYPTDVVVLEGALIAGTIDAIPELVRQSPNAKLIVQVTETDEANTVELYRRGVLPGETKNYVPGIIAAAIMAKNPAQYGLDKMVPMPPVLSDTVTTETAVDLRLVADVTGAQLGEIVALNPSLLRSTTPHDMSFDLHIPPGTKQLYAERMKEIPEDRRASWRFHVVRPGESLESIAMTLHARPAEISQANGLEPSETIAAGDELVIPVTTAASIAASHPRSYRVARGDSLITVADRFNVSVEDLRHWNRLTSSTIAPGRTLAVSEPIHLAPTGRARARASHRYAARGRSSAASARSSGGAHSRASTHPRAISTAGKSTSSASAKRTGSASRSKRARR